MCFLFSFVKIITSFFFYLTGINQMGGSIAGCRLLERADAAPLAGILPGFLRRPAAAAL
jgi:hypothetical protein